MFIKVYSSGKIPHIININSISTVRAEDKYWFCYGEPYPCCVRITFMNSEKELSIVKDTFEEACEEVERIHTCMEEYNNG